MVDDDLAFEVTPPVTSPAVPATVEPSPAPKPRPRRILGMTPLQLVILGGLALVFLCIMACFAYYFLSCRLEQKIDPVFDHRYSCP